MAQVFISYSHKDKEYARKLADELIRRGIEPWIDDRIDYGTQWPRVIQENLDACPGFIVIMSTYAYNSEWVQNEISYAQGKKKAIFPILLDGDVWVSFAAKQYANARNGKLPPDSYFETLKKRLGLKIVQSRQVYGNGETRERSDAEQLRERIVAYILKAVTNRSNGVWEIGLFRIGHYVPKKNPPKWMKIQEYHLNSEVINTELLRQYDSAVYSKYEQLYPSARLTDNLDKSKFNMNNFVVSANNIIKLRESLNLQLYMSSPTEFARTEIEKFATQLIDIHLAHHIPLSEMNIKVLE